MLDKQIKNRGKLVRLYNAASGFTGSAVLSVACLAMYTSHPDTKLWLAGVAVGLLGAVASRVSMYRVAKKDLEQFQESGNKSDPEFKP